MNFFSWKMVSSQTKFCPIHTLLHTNTSNLIISNNYHCLIFSSKVIWILYIHLLFKKKPNSSRNTFIGFETIIFLICYTCLLYLFCIKNDLANRHHQEKTLKTFFVVFDSDKPYNLKGMNSSIDHLKQKNTIRKLQLTSGNKKSIQKCISVTKRIAIWQFLYPVQEKGKQKSFFTWKPSKITAVVHPLK